MSVNPKFNAYRGIGWQNALGVCLAQADRLFFPMKVMQDQKGQSRTNVHERLLQAARKWQLEPAKVDEWLNMLRDTWPFEDRHRSARLMLKMYRLSSPETVAAAAADVLNDMMFEVMFFDATHSTKLSEGTAVLMGSRFAEISELLLPGMAGVYAMVEELRTDADLLQSEEASKVLFSKMAYLSLIPHFEAGEVLNYEIDSLLQLVTSFGRSGEFEEASEHILEEVVERFPDIVEQKAFKLAQEYRQEININISSRPWKEIRELVDSYGFATVWLPRESIYVKRELSRWREIFKSGKPVHARAAMIATSYLVINLLQDGWGTDELREIVDETLKGIGHGLFRDPADITDLLFRRIMIASGHDPDLAFYMASQLRGVAVAINAPSLLANVYATLFESIDEARREEETAKLRDLLHSSDASQEMIVAIGYVLERSELLREKVS